MYPIISGMLMKAIFKQEGEYMMNNYIKEIRALIGNRPLMLVGTSVIVYKDDMIILQRRADNGLWGYPGGLMEPGEEPEDSARRELREETGLIAQEMKLFGVFAGERRHFSYPNGHEVYITDVVYTCNSFTDSGESPDDEVLEVKWFPMNDLPSDLTSTTEDIIRKFVCEYCGTALK
jgi:ADP-ribose pyrophosphatase YjhB (NUDIX family)